MMAASMTKKSKPSPLQAPPTPQELSSSDVDAIRKANAPKQAEAAGTPSTLLTDPKTDSAKTTLLGQ